MTAAAALQRLISGYVVSQSVYVAARLGLADQLAHGPADAATLAPILGAEPGALHRLMRALTAYGVLHEQEDGRFSLLPVGDLLRADAPQSLRDQTLLFISPDFWATHGALEHCVRTGQTGIEHLFGTTDVFERYAADPVLGATFDAGMASMASLSSRAVAAAYDFPASGMVVDLGGGTGALLLAVLDANPGLSGTLVERAAVAERAVVRLGGRAAIITGDIFAAVPAGAARYLMSRVLHDWDDADCLTALRATRAAMTHADARLLVIERVMPVRMSETPIAFDHATGDLRMLVRTGGRERTESEFSRMFEAAGLRLGRCVPTAGPLGILEALPA